MMKNGMKIRKNTKIGCRHDQCRGREQLVRCRGMKFGNLMENRMQTTAGTKNSTVGTKNRFHGHSTVSGNWMKCMHCGSRAWKPNSWPQTPNALICDFSTF